MTFQVFHARDLTDPATGRIVGIAGRFGFQPTTFPDDFTLVATVIASEIGEVFQLTNHIDSNWTRNFGVAIPADVNPERLRSTSVGDIILDVAAGEYYLVAPVGFTQISTGRVPAAYGDLS